MITIALDEQGDFENQEGELTSKPVFIGGIVYNDGGEHKDYINERHRLKQYLKKVCESVGADYPRDLHRNLLPEGGDNRAYERIVKKQVGETIGEFFKNASYEGEKLYSAERKGQYYIFIYLKGEDGKTKLLGNNVSEAVRDSFASNLYLHMAEDVVERLIFHNPVIKDIYKIRLELARRMVVLKEGQIDKLDEYDKLGFMKNKENKSKIGYQLVNSYSYRTAIEREMAKSDNHKIFIDQIDVKSICYKKDKKGNEKKDMEFLYLADLVCANLSFESKGNTPAHWLKSFYRQSQTINSKVKNLVWSYSEADDYFSKSWKFSEEKDYYNSLSMLYEGIHCVCGSTNYYKEIWFPLISESLLKNINPTDFSDAVNKLKDYVYKSNINQDKLLYIYKNLQTMSNSVDFKNKEEEAELYNLYNLGMSAFNHVGNSKEAKKCYEQSIQYAKYSPIETYLRTRNKVVVFHCDMFEFNNALKIANENISYHEMLTEMKKGVFGSNFSDYINHAITLSQRGQVYAFMNNEKAEEDFLNALKSMDEETNNYLITQSYLLHYYIVSGMKEKYESCAKSYFGNNNTLIKQFEYIVKEGAKEKQARFSLKFALFVFMKALYIFYKDNLPKRIINILKNVEYFMANINSRASLEINGHPWEIIYKYIVLILHKYGEYESAERYIEEIKKFYDNYKGIVKIISEDCLKVCRSNNNENRDKRLTYMFF